MSLPLIAQTVNTLEQKPSREIPFRPGHSPFTPERVPEMVKYIFQGRTIGLYYQFFLLSVLLFATAIHWIQKLRSSKTQAPKLNNLNPAAYQVRYEKNQKKKTNDSNEQLFKNITLSGGTRIAADSIDIYPLIPKAMTRREQLTFNQKIYYKISGFLIKQPEIEAFMYCNWGMSLFITAYYLITLGFIFYEVQIRYPVILAFRLGLISAANLPLLYVFGTKHSPISWMIGWSYEQLNMFHQHIGNVCIKTFIAHTIIFLYYFRLEYLFTHLWSATGIVAGFCFFIILLSAHPVIKEKLYEFFYIVHLFGLIVCLPALWYHHPTTRPFVALAIFSIIYDRVIRVIKDYRLVYSTVEVKPGDTVVIKIPTRKNNNFDTKIPFGFLGRLLSSRPLIPWKPGQHVFITVVGCKLFESHPFTIASNYESSTTMDLVIRARNGFTRCLLEKTKNTGICERWVIIHGPYGTPIEDRPLSVVTVEKGAGISSDSELPNYYDNENYDVVKNSVVVNYQSINHLSSSSSRESISSLLPAEIETKFEPSRSKIILVAGGSGVAFTYPLYEEYRMALEYAEAIRSGRENHEINDEEADAYSLGSIEGCKITSIDVPEVWFFWIIPNRGYLEWLPESFSRQLESLEQNDTSVHIRLWVTSERGGRPDIDKEIRTMFFDGEEEPMGVKRREKCYDSCWIGVCGPSELVKQIRNAGGKLRQEGYDEVKVYTEVFAW